jgi:arylsulfatase A-like enzyme
MEASICSADKAFGWIVDAVRRSDVAQNTIIVFTADHGIAFPHAKMTLYDPGIQVPFILSVPGMSKGTVFHEMISNVDVLPTLLDLVDVPVPDNLHGRSFYGLLLGTDYSPRAVIHAEKTYHTYYDPMRAIRSHEWKLIANFENTPWQETSPDYDNNAKGYVEVAKALNVPYQLQYHPPFELYNLVSDPQEQVNLAHDAAYRHKRDELICALRQWMRDSDDPLLDGPMAQGCYRQRMNDFKHIRSPEEGEKG